MSNRRSDTARSRMRESTRSRTTASQALLGLLLVAALIASVALIFTDDVPTLAAVAVVAGLWAAAIGAILVTKFRRQAETAEAKSRDLRLVYELQLEREISARREYELGVENRVRAEVNEQTGSALDELRREVATLRSTLAQFTDLPPEGVSLPHEQRPILEASTEQPYGPPPRGYAAADYPPPAYPPHLTDTAFSATVAESAQAEQDFARTDAPVVGAHAQTGSGEFAEFVSVDNDEPVDAETVPDPETADVAPYASPSVEATQVMAAVPADNAPYSQPLQYAPPAVPYPAADRQPDDHQPDNRSAAPQPVPADDAPAAKAVPAARGGHEAPDNGYPTPAGRRRASDTVPGRHGAGRPAPTFAPPAAPEPRGRRRARDEAAAPPDANGANTVGDLLGRFNAEPGSGRRRAPDTGGRRRQDGQ